MENPELRRFVQIEKRDKLSRQEFSRVISVLDEKIWKNLKTETVPLEKLSGRNAANCLTPNAGEIPDCRTCGACCVALPSVEVEITDETQAEHFWNITIPGRNGEFTVNRFLKRDSETGNCLAFRGEVGREGGCAIYEERPETCRRFEAGSDKCRALRRAYGIDPPLTDSEMMSFMMNVFLKDAPEGEQRVIDQVRILETEIDGVFEIKVLLNDRTVLVLHRFDAEKEIWMESRFSALTVAEAKNLIASRNNVIY